MEVSQWGLNSKNNQSRTGPGHSMVVSQWSSSSTGFSSQPGVQVPTQRGARARPEGGREQLQLPISLGESTASYQTLNATGLIMTTRNLPVQASHTRPRNLGAGMRIGTHQVPPNPNPRGTSVRRWEGSHHIGAEVQGSPWYCYFGPIRAFR